METWSTTQADSPDFAMASMSLSSRVTLATSPRRTVPPVGRERIMFRTSSTVWNLASVETVSFLDPFSRLPPG